MSRWKRLWPQFFLEDLLAHVSFTCFHSLGGLGFLAKCSAQWELALLFMGRPDWPGTRSVGKASL